MANNTRSCVLWVILGLCLGCSDDNKPEPQLTQGQGGGGLGALGGAIGSGGVNASSGGMTAAPVGAGGMTTPLAVGGAAGAVATGAGGSAGTSLVGVGGASEGGAPLVGSGGGATQLGGAAGAPLVGSGGAPDPGLGGSAGTPSPGSGGMSAGGSVAAGGASSSLGGAGVGGAVTAAEECTVLGDVTFSLPSQTFRDQVAVEMATTMTGAEIRYTTDGTVPTSSSLLYSGSPITLTQTTEIRAQLFVVGSPRGKLSTAIYVARTVDLTSDLPIIIVDGFGKGKPTDKSVYADAAVMVFEPQNGTASLANLPTYTMRAGYHVRGQSSASFPQTPYKIEFWDNENSDLDCPMLGMPAESDWALIPPYYDRTLVRNPFIFGLGKDLGMEAPRNAFAEVYINNDDATVGELAYQGIYWVTETIKNNKNRTNLKQLREDDTELPDITGGYIFKFDQMATEEPTIACTGSDPLPGMGGFFPGGSGGASGGTCWTDLEVVDPDPLIDVQKQWLQGYVQEFHDALHATPMGDYQSHMDVQSFIDYLLISELSMNVDAYVRSAYYHKDRDGLLKAGPLWDYNFALGGVGAMNPEPTTDNPTGWRYSGSRNVNNWYPKLMEDPTFKAAVKARYTSLRSTLLSESQLFARMDALTLPLTQAIVRDYAKWPVEDIILSETGFVGGPTAPTWEGQIEVMKDFISRRLVWMDANLE